MAEIAYTPLQQPQQQPTTSTAHGTRQTAHGTLPVDTELYSLYRYYVPVNLSRLAPLSRQTRDPKQKNNPKNQQQQGKKRKSKTGRSTTQQPTTPDTRRSRARRHETVGRKEACGCRDGEEVIEAASGGAVGGQERSDDCEDDAHPGSLKNADGPTTYFARLI